MRSLVLGGGGFIGGAMTKRLKSLGHFVRTVDLKNHEYIKHFPADEVIIDDLRDMNVMYRALRGGFDYIFQFAADMGGAGYIFTGEHDADIMLNSAQININLVNASVANRPAKIFYSSSACMYPSYNQEDPLNPNCKESSAYPAQPDSEYGWEKLFSERLYLAAARNYGLDIAIARYHNIFGPEGTFQGGREKAPAAFCTKILQAPDGGTIQMWGDGKQTRSFLFIDDCIDATLALMESKTFKGPVNIGSEEMVSINALAKMVISLSGKNLSIEHIDGPLGVRGRSSQNDLILEKLGWEPKKHLMQGLIPTYQWISEQL